MGRKVRIRGTGLWHRAPALSRCGLAVPEGSTKATLRFDLYRRTPMNAIDLLKKQHEEAKELLSALEEAEVEDKEELFEKLADALAMHAAIEEQHFYPATKDDRTEELLQEAVEEHLSVKRLIADLLDMPPSEAQVDAKVKVLKEQLEHHIEEEESELFPEVKKAHRAQELDDLGALMEATAAELEQSEPRHQVPLATASARRATSPRWRREKPPRSTSRRRAVCARLTPSRPASALGVAWESDQAAFCETRSDPRRRPDRSRPSTRGRFGAHASITPTTSASTKMGKATVQWRPSARAASPKSARSRSFACSIGRPREATRAPKLESCPAASHASRKGSRPDATLHSVTRSSIAGPKKVKRATGHPDSMQRSSNAVRRVKPSVMENRRRDGQAEGQGAVRGFG